MFTRLFAWAALGSVLATSAVGWEPLYDDHVAQFDFSYPQDHFRVHHDIPDAHRPADFSEGMGNMEDAHPHFPHLGKPQKVEKTVYQFLSETPRFSRLFKVVNFSSEVTSLLNDSSKDFTFFALPNRGFPKRRHRVHQTPPQESHLRFTDVVPSWSSGLVESLTQLELAVSNEDVIKRMEEDPDHDKWREHLEKAVTAILKYHILPKSLGPAVLAQNTTYATSLANVHGALDNEPLRIRVGKAVPFGLSINLYSKTVGKTIETSNGIVHAITKPLVPFPSVFQTLFMFQGPMSIFTSAVQRVGLTDAVDFTLKGGEISGSPVTTVFAPSNRAFMRLPPRLRLFLFSPFGEKALKKLLQFHVVPNMTVHADWILNKTVESSTVESSDEFDFEEEESEDDEYDMEYENESMFVDEAFAGQDGFDVEDISFADEFTRMEWDADEPNHGGPIQGVKRVDRLPLPLRRPSGRCASSGLPPHRLHEQYFSPPPPPPPHQGFPVRPTPPPFHPGPSPCTCFAHPPPPPPVGGFCPSAMGRGEPGHRRRPQRPSRRTPPIPRWEGPRRGGPGGGPRRRAPHPPHPPPHSLPGRHFPPKPSSFLNLTLPTALTNHTLNVQVAKFNLRVPHLPVKHSKTVLAVNGQHAVFVDGVALNGAVHVVDRLLHPRWKPRGSPPPRHGGGGELDEDVFNADEAEDDWEDWEDWLLQWAVGE